MLTLYGIPIPIVTCRATTSRKMAPTSVFEVAPSEKAVLSPEMKPPLVGAVTLVVTPLRYARLLKRL